MEGKSQNTISQNPTVVRLGAGLTRRIPQRKLVLSFKLTKEFLHRVNLKYKVRDLDDLRNKINPQAG